MDKKIEEIIEKSKKEGILTERNRILNEIEKANLPVGWWTRLKPMFNPKDN